MKPWGQRLYTSWRPVATHHHQWKFAGPPGIWTWVITCEAKILMHFWFALNLSATWGRWAKMVIACWSLLQSTYMTLSITLLFFFIWMISEMSYSNPKMLLIHIKMSFDNRRQGKGFGVSETSSFDKFIRETTVLQCIKDENKGWHVT